MTLARTLSLSLVLLLSALAGCAPITPVGGDGIGVLRVSGPNVWLNGSPAADGDTVQFGNSLTTGPGSSALLEFRGGGYLQLDQNTDPVFEWLEQSRCILIRIFKGQAYLKKERACIEGPNISMVLNSEVNLRIQPPPGPSEVTLLKGRAEVSLPAPVMLQPGQQLVATSARRAPAVRTLSPAELRAIVAWRDDFRFRPLPVRPEGPKILLPPRTPRRPDSPTPQPDPGTGGAEPGGPVRWPDLERPRGDRPVLDRPVRKPVLERPIRIPAMEKPSEPVIK